ncbi:hypothetical protein CHCC14808_3470 [Bacillus licheniformis]|nr:hypothetical protein CHCC14808_3470 [Bacillus licheniformis]TWN27102.1 hypothetical protein CHCC14557_3614 [Bacillus licheniformis]
MTKKPPQLKKGFTDHTADIFSGQLQVLSFEPPHDHGETS